MTLRCSVVKPGVYNLNRFKVAIVEGEVCEEEHPSRGHFVSEIRLPDDIMLTVSDSPAAAAADLISLD